MAPQQPGDVAGEKMGLVQTPSSLATPGEGMIAAGPGPLPPCGSAVPAGMGLPTMSAARIYKGQLAGGSGEESVLAMETFPHVALAKVSGAALGDEPCCPCPKPHWPLLASRPTPSTGRCPTVLARAQPTSAG